jgi:murein DD-endopeptidase MepM/ murein hydrolase activator NlpD
VDWPPARRTSTLLHEYLHVRRWDVPVAEGLRLITTLAWFSPFPWFALSLALKLREQACDGAVLRAGIARAAYATDLLDAARSLARPRPAASASICAGSSLEIRIRAVLEDPLVQPLRDRLARTAAAGALLAGALGMARSAGPLYSIPEFSSREALPRGPGEWGAGADPRPGGTTLQGAFSLSLEGDYARIRLRFRGRLREFRLPAAALPGSLPLSGRARMIVPFGDLVDDQARKPFFNPGWSIWDGRQVPVRAAAPGRVLATRIDPRYGLVIEVDHGAGLRTRYGLGRQGVSNVVAGEYVSPWAPIGTLGACSPYDLPVLNFSILVQFGAERVALDPAPFLLAQAESRGTPLCASVVNAAVRLQDRAELERLIAGGAALNHPSADGTLPLEWALMNGNLAIAKDLVAAGADPRAATWNVHQAHIALHGPTVAELARDSANPAFAALLAPVQGTAGARSPAGAPNLWH